jgi:hypothetical protein
MPLFGLPAPVALVEQRLRAVQHGLRLVGIAGGDQRVVALDGDARAQQKARRIVERMNGHQIATRHAVERLAGTVERAETERADHQRQRHQNDPHHGQ